MALAHLWSTLDGKNAANPLRDVPVFEEPEAEPRNLPPALVTSILELRQVAMKVVEKDLDLLLEHALWAGVRRWFLGACGVPADNWRCDWPCVPSPCRAHNDAEEIVFREEPHKRPFDTNDRSSAVEALRLIQSGLGEARSSCL
jgi:hypothetical protein